MYWFIIYRYVCEHGWEYSVAESDIFIINYWKIIIKCMCCMREFSTCRRWGGGKSKGFYRYPSQSFTCMSLWVWKKLFLKNCTAMPMSDINTEYILVQYKNVYYSRSRQYTYMYDHLLQDWVCQSLKHRQIFSVRPSAWLYKAMTFLGLPKLDPAKHSHSSYLWV